MCLHARTCHCEFLWLLVYSLFSSFLLYLTCLSSSDCIVLHLEVFAFTPLTLHVLYISLIFNIVIVLHWAKWLFLTQLLVVTGCYWLFCYIQFPFECIKLFLFNFVSGSSCCWTTTAQPSTSWCCLSATMKRSSWRSSTDRWRSTQTSSVSPSS